MPQKLHIMQAIPRRLSCKTLSHSCIPCINILMAEKSKRKQKQKKRKRESMWGRSQTCHALTSSEVEMPEGTQRRQVGQGTISQLLTAPEGEMGKAGERRQHCQSALCQTQAIPQHQVLQAVQILDMLQTCSASPCSSQKFAGVMWLQTCMAFEHQELPSTTHQL